MLLLRGISNILQQRLYEPPGAGIGLHRAAPCEQEAGNLPGAASGSTEPFEQQLMLGQVVCPRHYWHPIRRAVRVLELEGSHGPSQADSKITCPKVSHFSGKNCQTLEVTIR